MPILMDLTSLSFIFFCRNHPTLLQIYRFYFLVANERFREMAWHKCSFSHVNFHFKNIFHFSSYQKVFFIHQIFKTIIYHILSKTKCSFSSTLILYTHAPKSWRSGIRHKFALHILCSKPPQHLYRFSRHHSGIQSYLVNNFSDTHVIRKYLNFIYNKVPGFSNYMFS